MNAQKRAEKIAELCCLTDDEKALVAQQIEEAERESDKKIIEAYQTGLERGFTAAKGRAVAIALRPWDYCPTEDGKYAPLYQTAEEIAARLSAMTVEDK